MPNISVQLRRGTDTEHSSFTGAEGEVTVDTTNDTLRVHDGTTAGGIRLAKLSEVSGGTGTVTEVDAGTGLVTSPATGIITTGTIGIAAGGVGATQLATNAVTSDKLAAQAVTADKLANTAVTPGAYTSANITVDQQGRITAAASGSGAISKYSSGWFNNTTGLANGGTYSFTHGLGTNEAQVQIWMATSSAGADIKLATLDTDAFASSSSDRRGASITALTTTSVTVQLAVDGWVYLNTSGSAVTGNWGTTYTHIKVVVIG